MTEFTIPVSAIQAALQFAASGGSRPCLIGVHIEKSETETRLIASDGVAAIIIRIGETTDGVPATFTVPRTLLGHIKGEGDCTVRYSEGQDGAVGEVEISRNGTAFRGQELTDFPDIYRIVPSELSGECSQFDVEYLARTAKAARLLGGKRDGHVVIHHNGENAALAGYSGVNNMAVVLMPLIAAHLQTCWTLLGWVSSRPS